MILKESQISDVTYHNLASGPLAADRHSHPLLLFAFSGFVLYTKNPGVRTPAFAGKNAQVSAGASPELSKSILVQSFLFMSQRYNPPVTVDFCPAKDLALGAPTSSLQQKPERRLSTCTLQLWSSLTFVVQNKGATFIHEDAGSPQN